VYLPAGKIKTIYLLAAVSIAFLAALGLFGYLESDLTGFFSGGLASVNRIINQLLTVVLTAIALVIPLSSNLYSPKLVRLFLSHPLIVAGLSIVIFTQTLCLVTLMIGPEHLSYQVLAFCCYGFTLICLAGLLPFLYFVSFFLRPDFFVPLLAKRARKHIDRWGEGELVPEHGEAVFDTADMIANIALTGMHRGDKQLVLLCVHALHELLICFIKQVNDDHKGNEGMPAFFVSGLVREAQEYLREKQIWPEAYMLAKIIEVVEHTDVKHHQILAEIAQLLVASHAVAVADHREDHIEIHTMVFNALMRNSIEEKDLRKFQNLSYHFRLIIETLVYDPMWMEEAVRHLVHYGKLADAQGMPVAYKTVIYDIGELTLSLIKVEDHAATQFVEQHAGPIWFEAIHRGGGLEIAARRCIVRLYWEAQAAEIDHLCELLMENFLNDEDLHRETLEKILANNRPLHWEFNDRLLKLAHISPAAEAKAWEFVMG
jgi:hypothetical protein